MHRDIVAAGAPEPADRPRVDDLALAGGQQHEADFRAARRGCARPALFMDDRPQNHPSRELAAADQRPPPGQAEAAVDNMRLTRGTRTVGRDDVPIVMDGVCRLSKELSCGPVRIAVPHTPRHRRIGFRQFLEDRGAVHRRQVEPAVGRRQENAEKPGACEVTCEIFRHPSRCFDSIALCHNTRLEFAGSCKKRRTVGGIVVHH
jgi:hypothetical protein